MTLLGLLWSKASETLYLTEGEFLASLDGWTVEPVHLDGELAWITVQKGPEFHFQSVGRKRAMPRRMIEEFLRPIIEAHGYAITKTPKNDERQHRFNLLFGFEKSGEDEFDTHFKITRLKHA